jgi:hypothetical protein
MFNVLLEGKLVISDLEGKREEDTATGFADGGADLCDSL